MRAAHLSSIRGDFPYGLVKIELPPFGLSKLARTRKQIGHQLQGRDGRRLTLKTINGPQERTQRLWIGNGRAVLYLRCCQCAAKGECWIVVGPCGGDCIPEHLADDRAQTLGGFE